MTNHSPACIYCDQGNQTVPLLLFLYQDEKNNICAQHLPVLIHNPSQLAGKLPGLELVKPAEGHS